MLSFLLDAHISPDTCKQLQIKYPSVPIHTLQTWQQGTYLKASDEIILNAAYPHSLTLVTYDLRTIPRLLKVRSIQNKPHAGIVFINAKTVASNDIGRLVESLALLWQKEHNYDWTNRIQFLGKPWR